MKVTANLTRSLKIPSLSHNLCPHLLQLQHRSHQSGCRRSGKSNMATYAQAGSEAPNMDVISEAVSDPEIARFQEHQASAAKLSLAEEARTLVQAGRWGVLSTIASGKMAGYPAGSVVEYATNEQGFLYFAFSTMSSHTTDVRTIGKASITITSPGFKGLQDARISLVGDIEPVQEPDLPSVKQIYKQQHPNSFWVDFGDFSMWKLSPKVGRLIGGFARAGQVSAEDYFAAKPDPVSPYSEPIAAHMNTDHADATKAIVKHVAGITVGKAEILTLDRLGMMVNCERDGETFKARIPFSRPAESRAALRDVIVEMTKATR